MAPFHIPFEQVLPNQSVHAVYAGILRWAQAERAKIKVEQPPVFMQVAHGRASQMFGWRKDAKKTIDFHLTQVGPDTHVRVKVTPPALNAGDIQMRMEAARTNWGELLADIWVRFGVSGAHEKAAFIPEAQLEAAIRQGRSMIVVGVLFLVGGLAVGFVLSASRTGGSAVYVGGPVIGLLSIITGWMRMSDAKKRKDRVARGPPP